MILVSFKDKRKSPNEEPNPMPFFFLTVLLPAILSHLFKLIDLKVLSILQLIVGSLRGKGSRLLKVFLRRCIVGGEELGVPRL